VIYQQVVRGPHNADKIDRIRDYWSGVVDHISVKPEFEAACYTRPREKFYQGSKRYCHRPYEHITVWPDGSVVLCCCDFDYYVLGNINEADPLGIYNSEAFWDIRDGMASGQKIPSLCKNCLEATRRV